MDDQSRIDDLTGLSGTGRYIAMYGYNRLHPWGYSLFEFEVYGSLSLKSANSLAQRSENMYEVISVYPNPIEDELNFEGAIDIRKISIYDITGNIKVTSQIDAFNDQLSMDISFLSSGVYFIKIEGENFAQTQKIIKK